MQRAEALLEIIHERGKRGLPLERLYRHLFNPELYLLFVDRTTGRHAGGGGSAGQPMGLLLAITKAS